MCDIAVLRLWDNCATDVVILCHICDGIISRMWHILFSKDISNQVKDLSNQVKDLSNYDKDISPYMKAK